VALISPVALAKTGHFDISLGEKGPDGEWNYQYDFDAEYNDGWKPTNDFYGPEGAQPLQGPQANPPWFPYPAPPGSQTDPWSGIQNPQPAWLNEWWYDDPYDPDRWKELDVSFLYGSNPQIPGQNGYAEVWINYTTPEYSEDYPGEQAGPPLTNEDPNDPSRLYIGRTMLGAFQVPADTPPTQFSQEYDLRDYQILYNPEWISIDVTGFNFLLAQGVLEHECVGSIIPEPVTVLGLFAGIGGLAGYFRRRARR
jgi:hypothetical protein